MPQKLLEPSIFPALFLCLWTTFETMHFAREVHQFWKNHQFCQGSPSVFEACSNQPFSQHFSSVSGPLLKTINFHITFHCLWTTFETMHFARTDGLHQFWENHQFCQR